MTRDEKVAAEAAALWREVFGGKPPPKDASSMLEVLTAALPDVRYDRIRSPFLRPALISRPRGRG